MSDIAKKAGVSRTAVSFVLNGRERAGGSISETTRARVLMAAEELNYKPNELARAMTRGRSRVIGFLTRNPQAEHVARMVSGALDEADERGYFVKILRVRGEEREDGFDQRLLDQCIELRLAGSVGTFLWPLPIDQFHDELAQFEIPFALLDDSEGDFGWGSPILADYGMGMRQAVEHLVSLGHQKIGFVGGPQRDPGTQDRLNGFQTALHSHDLKVNPRWMLHSSYYSLVENILPQLQALDELPTAFVGATDPASMALVRAAAHMQLSVPRDLSVVSFGDLSIAYLSNPPLTAIHHPFYNMGRQVVAQLLDSLENASKDLKTASLPSPSGGRIATHLIVRESTAPPAR